MRLRLGRFAWELYYTRTRAVLPREEVRRRVALICGHMGYITGLFEYVMTDMFWMRFWATTGCALIVTFQVSQPRIQWISTFWNSTFVCVNVYHMYLLKRRLPALSEQEASLFAALGGEDRLTKQHFQELLEIGSWKVLEPGDRVVEEGRSVQNPEVGLMASGTCDVFLGGLLVGKLGAGSIIGEVWELVPDPEEVPKNSVRSATVKAGSEGACCFFVPLGGLMDKPKIREALHGVFALALADKVLTMNQESRLRQYAAVLEVACAAGPDPPPAVLDAVADFRQRYGVTDEEHNRATQAVPHSDSNSLLWMTMSE